MSALPTLRFEIGSVLAPGDRIASARHVSTGAGTYSRGGHVYSSSLGKLVWKAGDNTVCVEPSRPLASSWVLSVGQIVLGKVQRIIMQQVIVEIVAAEGVGALPSSHEGAVRKEDVRKGATEEIVLRDCFQPGDVVLCRVLSIGDSRRYILTTAETELGVLRALCAKSGYPMKAMGWKEMECTETGIKEPRKCAKPTDLHALLAPRRSDEVPNESPPASA